MNKTPSHSLKSGFLLALLAVFAVKNLCAQPSAVVTPPEVRILTYTNASYHYHDGQQDWIYSPTETRHGGGYLRTHNKSTFHRHTGGTHTNFSGNHSYATGYPQIYEWYVETRSTINWAGPLPATSSFWSYYTNTYWFDGMTAFIPDEGSSSSTETNFTWEPSESRKMFRSEDVPDWTFIFTWGEPHQGYFEKWTNHTGVETTLELSAGVYPDPIQDTAIILNVWAYDNLRQRFLTQNEFTVGGRTPDLNGNLFYRIKDNQRTNLTYNFSPTNALPTDALPGSHDYSFWAHPQWVHFSIAVDRNADEQIEHYWTNDLTTVDLPYLFWANNDRDFFQAHSGPGPSYYEFDDIQTTTNSATDFGFAYIHNERDLEDLLLRGL